MKQARSLSEFTWCPKFPDYFNTIFSFALQITLERATLASIVGRSSLLRLFYYVMREYILEKNLTNVKSAENDFLGMITREHIRIFICYSKTLKILTPIFQNSH